MTQPRDTIAGLVLAGGKSRRMGADKAFLMLNGRPLLAHVIERARSQVDTLLISANDDPQRYAVWDAPVLADAFGQLGAIGPLAGIFTALVWLRAKRPDVRWLAAFACDTPFLDRKSTRLNSSHVKRSRMPSSA